MWTNTSGRTDSHRAPAGILLLEDKPFQNPRTLLKYFSILNIRNFSPFLPLPDVTAGKEDIAKELRSVGVSTKEILYWNCRSLITMAQLQVLGHVCFFSQFKHCRTQCWDWQDSAVFEIVSDPLYSFRGDCQQDLKSWHSIRKLYFFFNWSLNSFLCHSKQPCVITC